VGLRGVGRVVRKPGQSSPPARTGAEGGESATSVLSREIAEKGTLLQHEQGGREDWSKTPLQVFGAGRKKEEGE